MDKVKQAGAYMVGTVVAAILIVIWVLQGLTSCVLANPCPGYADEFEHAIERGDEEAANRARDTLEANCDVKGPPPGTR